MKIYGMILLVVCFFTGCVSNNSKISQHDSKFTDPTDKYYYDCVNNTKNNYKGGPIEIDFTKFRYSYFLAEQKDNALTVDNSLEKKLGEAFSSENWEEVIKVADSILDHNFTRTRAHVLKSFAYRKLGIESELNTWMLGGLIESIVSSGDGKSFETAFHVFRVEEEYDLLKYLQLFPVSQSLVEHNGDMFDCIECKNSNDQKFEVYFKITEHFASLRSRIENRAGD